MKLRIIWKPKYNMWMYDGDSWAWVHSRPNAILMKHLDFLVELNKLNGKVD